MDHSKKLDFIHKMARLGLEHFDSGGAVQTQGGGLLGGVSDALGLTNKFTGSSADIQSPITDQDAYYARSQARQGIDNQINLLNQTAAQNGLGNQSQVYGQLQGIANGTGPNPALAQLNQSTAANTANQAALMASQRGASSNPALIARQAAQQGAANQQQAAGQAATLQAQQSLGALDTAGNLATNQANQQANAVNNLSGSTQNEQNTVQNAIAGQNNARVNMQSNINNVNAQTALGNQQSNTNLLGSVAKGASAAAPMLSGLFAAEGGEIHKFANGGAATTPLQSFVGNWLKGNSDPGVPLRDPGSIAAPTPPKEEDSSKSSGGGMGGGSGMGGGGMGGGMPFDGAAAGSPGMLPGFGMADGIAGGSGAGLTAGGGDALLGGAAADGAGAGIAGGAAEAAPLVLLAARGGNIRSDAGGPVKATSPKQKAVVRGNSYSNDRIPAMLSEGEIVLPRKVTMHKNAPKMAAEFVRKVQAKKKQGLKR